MSLNGALSVASGALQLFSLGIQVAGNNIANASTPGYIRETLKIAPASPYPVAGGLVGAGAQAVGVRQIFDRYLEARIHTANTAAASADVRYSTYLQLESTIGELGDNDLSSSLNEFIQSLQNAANQPDNAAYRSIVIQQGTTFANDVVSLRQRVGELRDSYSNQMRSLVDEANTLIQQIQDLNPKIGQLEANGLDLSEAGALRVQRLNALNRLSEIIPIRTQEQPSGSIDVYTDSDYLILGGSAQRLEAVMAPTESGVAEVNVQTTASKASIGGQGGELGGLIESRDRILTGFITQLDTLASSIIQSVNEIHSSGQGLVGFTDVTGTNYVTSTTAPLDSAGLSFAPRHGSFEIQVRNTTTGVTETHQIPIDLDNQGTSTSLEDLRTALDGLGRVSATITPDRKLRISTDAGYEVRFGNDTSGVLASLGINTFFTGNASDNIGINAIVTNDQRFLASGQGGGPADNSNLLQLSQVMDKSNTRLNGMSIDTFYTTMISQLGQSASAEEALATGSKGFRDSLITQREQRSGVSVDEEAILILQLQRNYQAAARIITTVDQLMNTLLQI